MTDRKARVRSLRLASVSGNPPVCQLDDLPIVIGIGIGISLRMGLDGIGGRVDIPVAFWIDSCSGRGTIQSAIGLR